MRAIIANGSWARAIACAVVGGVILPGGDYTISVGCFQVFNFRPISRSCFRFCLGGGHRFSSSSPCFFVTQNARVSLSRGIGKKDLKNKTNSLSPKILNDDYCQVKRKKNSHYTKLFQVLMPTECFSTIV